MLVTKEQETVWSSDYSAGVPIKKRRFPIIRPSPQREDSSSVPTQNDTEEQVSCFSSEHLAGIPIKKRKFPIVQPPSPPREVRPILPKENKLQEKGPSNPPQDSAVLNASLVATRVSGLSDASKTIVPEEDKNTFKLLQYSELQQKGYSSSSQSSNLSNFSGVAEKIHGLSNASNIIVPKEEKRTTDLDDFKLALSNGNHPIMKFQEPILTTSPVSLACMEKNEPLVESENSCNTLISLAKTELKLAPNEAFALDVGKDTATEQKMEGKCQSELYRACRNTKLSIGLREHCISAITGQNSEESSQKHVTEESVSLSLSLSKMESGTQHKSNESQTSNGGADIFNRSNWDLNTTMDAWAGDLNDVGSFHGADGDLSMKGASHDTMPIKCMNVMVDRGFTSEKLNRDKNGCEFHTMTSSTPSGKPHVTNDSLRLGLSPSCSRSISCEKTSSLSEEVSQKRCGCIMGFPRLAVSSSNSNMTNLRAVKSEPLDDNIRHDIRVAKTNPLRSLKFNVKHELAERVNKEILPSNVSRTLKLVNPRSMKLEPSNEVSSEAVKEVEGTLSLSDVKMLQANDNRGKLTCLMSKQADKQLQQAKNIAVVPACLNEDEKFNFGSSRCTNTTQGSHEMPEVAHESERRVALETVSVSIGHDSNKPAVTNVKDSAITENQIVNDPDKCIGEFEDNVPPNSQGSVDGSVSDEEKINLSGDMLEDSYGSDYESDGNHDSARGTEITRDGFEEGFEDGEVRESAAQTSGHRFDKCDTENGGDSDKAMTDCTGISGDVCPSSFHTEVKITEAEHIDDGSNNDDLSKFVESGLHDESHEGAANKKSLTGQVLTQTEGVDMKRPIEVVQGKIFDMPGKMDAPESVEREQSSDQATNTSKGTLATSSLCSDGNVDNPDMIEKSHSALPKAEVSSNSDDAAKNSGGSQSRIIDLSRASSPGQPKCVSGRLLPPQIGGGKLLDVAVDEDNFRSRGRDEVYGVDYQKFSRERYHEMQPRASRMNFVRGRGRFAGRAGTGRGEWNSQRDFSAGFYNGRREFPASGRKYETSAMDTEANNYNDIAHDASFVGGGRGGRKFLNNDTSFFRHLPRRRHSPGGRGGPTTRGVPIDRRGPRNISPGRCNGEEGSILLGFRHNEKFIRGFSDDDDTDPVFARSQPSYEGLDDQFVRGHRNYSSVQRRGPRVRSKSPIRSRARSPGQWSSPRRRTPDGFGGHPELPHRRSSPVYRMERLRSPDHPCFPGDLVVRRHGSPAYPRATNDLRDMEAVRDHNHPRSGIPNRSPSGRVLLRNNRRFDAVDSRQRTESNDYFGPQLHSNRFQELGGDGNNEGRRRFGERREHVRTFRPPYNGVDGENYHINTEDDIKSFRFCQDDNLEFSDRGNVRDFDRRIKNRPGDAPRRTRSIEEHEGNFRHGGQVWHDDDGFDDNSRVKRKRFD